MKRIGIPDGNQHIYPQPEIREKWRLSLLGKEMLGEKKVQVLYMGYGPQGCGLESLGMLRACDDQAIYS